MGYTGVHVFGDSFVDAGNALALAEWYGDLTFSDLPDGAPSAEDGYYLGRFSNGLTFADLVSNHYLGAVTEPVFPYGYEDPWFGLPVAPWASEPGGNNLNWAYGGAQIIRGSEAVSPLDAQTDAFRDAVDGDPDAGALYLVAIGGNDVRSLVPRSGDPVPWNDPADPANDAESMVRAAAAELLDELEELVALGVTNIVITGIPDIGSIPQYDLDEPGTAGFGTLEGDELYRSQVATEYSRFLDALIQLEVVPALQALGATVTYLPLMDLELTKADVENASAEQLQLWSDYYGVPVADFEQLLAADFPADQVVSFAGVTSENFALLEQLWGMAPGSLDTIAHQSRLFVDEIHPNAQLHALLAAAMLDQVNGTTSGNRLPMTAPGSGIAPDYRLKGAIAAAGEVDRIIVSLDSNTAYTFELLGVSSAAWSVGNAAMMGMLADPGLRVVGPDGTLVTAGADAGLGLDESISFTTGSLRGDYVIELSGVGSLTGTYELLAEANAAANNSYIVSHGNALIFDAAAANDFDVARTSVSYTLNAQAEIEQLRTTNDRGKAQINLTGNSYDQEIFGNAGANRIDGKAGSDTLWGLAGKDTFVFSVSPSRGVDRIEDFNVRNDTIALEDSIFGGTAGSTLASGAFALSTAAAQADDRIIYNSATGELFYDATGGSRGDAVLFAVLDPGLRMTAADFIFV